MSTDPVIVTPQGRPARETVKKDDRCPECGAGREKRVPSTGIGQTPHPICSGCGHEWRNEVFGG